MTNKKHALKFALQSPCTDYRHGAVIHKRGRPIVGAFNIPYKTHPEGSGPFGTCHAEVRAIAKARSVLHRDDLTGYSLYVLRVNRRGEMKLSKPCNDCMALIKEHNLSVEWST
jgi:tRNA(Arg) A34 adenosine deaminase TadA